MPRYRAGAFEKGSRQKGQYVVVEANSAADAMLNARPYFPGVPIGRFFAYPAEQYDKVDHNKHPFTAKPNRGSQ